MELQKIKAAHQVLPETRDYYQLIFDRLADAVLVLEADTGTVLDVNQPFCQLFGYSPADARNLSFAALFPDSPDWPSLRAAWEKAAADNGRVLEGRARHHSGRKFWAEARLTTIRLPNQPRLLAVVRDIEAQKLAEEALKESEARYRTISEESLAGVYVIQEGRFIYANSTMARVFGYEPGEFLKVDPKGLVYPEDLPLVKENIRQRLEGELEEAHYTFRGLRRDGTVIWCESFGRRVDYQGQPAVVGTLIDRTERKRVEEALKQSEQRYRAVVEDQTELIVRFRPDMTLTFVNDALCRYLGLAREELLGQSFLPFLAEADRTEHKLASLTLENPIVTLEEQVLKPDGSIAWHQWTNRAIFDDQGQIAEFQAVGRDITDHRQAEEELRLQKNLMNAIVSATPDLLVLKNKELRYVAVNPAFCRHLGKTEADLIGKTDFDIFPPAEAQKYRTDDLKVMETGRALFADEAVPGHDRQHWFHVIRTPLRDAQGQTTGILASVRDITERKSAEKTLITQSRVLESMMEGVVVCDQSGIITLTNPAFDAMFGYGRGDLLGSHISVLTDLPPEENARLIREMIAELQSQGNWAGEFRNRRRDGTRFYTRGRISTLSTPEGECWLMVQEDITEWKQIEEALRESEASYRIVTESSLAGVYVIQDGKFRYVNPMFAEAFGYTPDEIIDRLGPLDLVHPDDRDRITEDLRRRLTGKLPGPRHSFTGLRRDGSSIYCEVLTRPVEYHGRPAMMGTLMDVTERRLAEEALKASEVRYRTIFNRVNDAILVFDPVSGNIAAFNSKFLQMTGYAAEEAERLTMADLCSRETSFTWPEVRRRIDKVVQDGPHLFEWRAWDRTGRRFWIELSLSLTPLSGNIYILAVFRDISERKELEKVRRKTMAELEHRVQERTVWLATANMQLMQEIESRKRTQALLLRQRDLAVALSGRVGIIETLRFCLQTAIDIAGMDGGGVYLVEPSGALTLTCHQGLSVDFISSVSYFSGDSLNAHFVLASKPVYARLEDLPGLLDETGLREGLRSAAIIPVAYKGQVIACINAVSRKYEEVPETSRVALEALAAQMGSAIARAQAEEGLRESDERFRAFMDFLPGISFMMDPDNRLIYLNQNLENIMREVLTVKVPENFLGKTHADLWPPAVAERYDAQNHLVLSTGKPARFIEAFEQADGVHTWLVHKFPILRSNGNPTLVGAICIEITELEQTQRELRQAKMELETRVSERTLQLKTANVSLQQELSHRQAVEESLRRSEAKYRTLVEQIPAITYIISVSDTVTLPYISPQIQTLMGFSPEEWQADPGLWKHQIHPEDRERVWDELKTSYRAGRLFASEYRMLTKSGEIVWFRDEASVVSPPGARPLLLQGLALDITARKRAEEDLREANYKLQVLIQGSPLAIVAVNTEGQVISWNPAAEGIFGWRQEDVMGQALPIVPEEQRRDFEALRRRKMREGPLLGLEVVRQKRDGSRVEVSLSSAPLYDAAGNTTGSMSIITDITERRRLDEAFRKVSRALKAITACQHAMIRAASERELLDEVCRIIVEVGGYRMAWVGYADPDAGKAVQPVAQKGLDAGYIEKLKLTWGEDDRGRGPTGTAIRTGKATICRDTEIDPNFGPWRTAARRRGFKSVLAIPLPGPQGILGALSIYSSAIDAFDDGEINLLIGLANDLVYGITAIRGQTERRQAEQALKESEQELRLLTSQLLNFQEDERRRVSRELHDELGQALTVLKINLVAIEERLKKDQRGLKSDCEQMLSYIDAVIENVRRLSWDLSPSTLEDLGLTSSLGYLIEDICRNNNITSKVVMDQLDNLFAPKTQIHIYRIIQESLTNIAKHAEATAVRVEIKKKDDQVTFVVRDNGRGFDLEEAISGKVERKSLGLTAMNERARMVHGHVNIWSRIGKGTRITLTIPIDAGEE